MSNFYIYSLRIPKTGSPLAIKIQSFTILRIIRFSHLIGIKDTKPNQEFFNILYNKLTMASVCQTVFRFPIWMRTIKLSHLIKGRPNQFPTSSWLGFRILNSSNCPSGHLEVIQMSPCYEHKGSGPADGGGSYPASRNGESPQHSARAAHRGRCPSVVTQGHAAV